MKLRCSRCEIEVKKIPPPKLGGGIVAFGIRLFYRWKLKIEFNTIFKIMYAMRSMIHGKDL